MKIHRITALATLLALTTLTIASPAWAEEVSFSDGAHDAYRIPGNNGMPLADQPPNPLLSDPGADILDVGLATVATSKGNAGRKSYSVTMSITGPADKGYNYVVAGKFGEDCDLFHFLTPGTTSVANAFCDGTSRFIGQIVGSAVVANGTTLTATFTYMPKKLPAELAADTQLGPLYAYTCSTGDECRSDQIIDWDEAPAATFTI